MEERTTDRADRMVSVVLPTYNRGWIVEEAVDSVLSQDYPAMELIVVDDGSTDGTPEILDRYGDRIRVIRQRNRGVSAARNAGIDAASGELIAFLDSDDRWLEGKVREQVRFFRDHPEALICQTEEIWIRDGIRVNPKRRHRKRSGGIFIPSLDLCLVSPSAVMVKRRLFDLVGTFDEALPACEDYDLWLRVSCRHPIHLIDLPLVVKRGGHGDQLSRAPGLDRYRIRAIDGVIKGGLLSQEERAAAGRVLRQKCAVYAGGCLKRGRTAEADHYRRLAAAHGEEGAAAP